MRFKHLLTALFLFTSFACAQDPKPYQTGNLSQVDPSSCNLSNTKSVGTCQQYVLESDAVIFHIRPRHTRDWVPLPEGDRAQFRIQNGNILLQMEGVNGKEREYIVMSIAPRSESSSADARPVRLNHLQ